MKGTDSTAGRLDGARVLVYSHDSFGLGHLRRCRAIAHSLVERYKGLSALILSGSPIISSFDFRARVDFVRIPGVIKLHNGKYTSLGRHIDLKQTLAMRASIIHSTAAVFRPHLFLVDKEPLGLGGEVTDTLAMLKTRGAATVLGMRDVMDDTGALAREWEEKRVAPALRELYDKLWVYGPPIMGNPIEGLAVLPAVRHKMTYTGYLRRQLPQNHGDNAPPAGMEQPFILITAGGGGDGADMMDWAMRAYELAQRRGGKKPLPALAVLGPFMPPAAQRRFRERAARIANLETLTFDSRIEFLMSRAAGMVAMGGYNTFCEILSLDKRALLVPRTRPRREQLIRAERAQRLGLVTMLNETEMHDTEKMLAALLALPHQPPPSRSAVAGLMSGLDVVNREVKMMVGARAGPGRGAKTAAAAAGQ